MRLFLPNLTFDDCLAGRTVRQSPELERVIGALAPLMGLLATPDDIVIVPEGHEPTQIPECLKHVVWQIDSPATTFPPAAILTPWGWDELTLQTARRMKLNAQLPSISSVSKVNGRQFLAAFDIVRPEFGQLPFGDTFGRLCTSERCINDGLARLSSSGIDEWIIKGNWGASGRNRTPGRGTRLNLQQLNWTRKQLKSCGAVYLEPQVSVIRECSIQLEVLPTRDSFGKNSTLLGVVELITDEAGRYTGSIVSGDWDRIWQPAVEHGRAIADEAVKTGYFGPLGIDCMLVRMPDGTQGLRLSHDINGRHTMGRLALSLLPRLKAGQAGFWQHGRPTDLDEDHRSEGNFPAGMPVNIVDSLSTSPGLVGGQTPAVRTQFLVTSNLSDARILAELARERHQQKN